MSKITQKMLDEEKGVSNHLRVQLYHERNDHAKTTIELMNTLKELKAALDKIKLIEAGHYQFSHTVRELRIIMDQMGWG